MKPEPYFEPLHSRDNSGNYMTVASYVRRLRQAQWLQLRQLPPRRLRQILLDRQRQGLTPHQAAWLGLRHPGHRNADETARLTRLKQHPSFATALEQAEAFINLVRHRQGQHFDQRRQ